MVTEAQARQIIGVDGARVLVDVVQGGWDDYLAEGRVRPRRTRADIVWDHMTARADRSLALMEGVQRFERHSTPLYVLRDRLLLRLKKHNQDLETSNVQTRDQRRLARIGHFDGLPHPHVTCGYVLDSTEAEVERVVVVRRVDGDVEWFIDLRELAGGNMQPATPILPNFPPVADADRARLPGIALQRKNEGEQAP